MSVFTSFRAFYSHPLTPCPGSGPRQMSMKKAAITSRVMPSFLRFGSAQLAAKRGSVATSGQPVATPLSMEVYQVCW